MYDFLEIAKEWNSIHKDIIGSSVPLSSIKIGSVESEAVSDYLKKRPVMNKRSLWLAAGVCCPSEESFERWCEAYIKGIKSCDYVHLWQSYCFKNGHDDRIEKDWTDDYLVGQIKPNLKHTPTSYPHDEWLPFALNESGWHYSLADKKVLVVSSAKKTFEHQAKIYDKIWVGAKLGGFEFVKVPSSEILTGEDLDNPVDWSLKVKKVQDEICTKDFDFAMVGCGGIGLIINDFIKNEMKRSCTYLGGTLQLFFGIRGNRWEWKKSPYYNAENWVCPFKEDIPKNYLQHENGCYWVSDSKQIGS
jgi:hypothetical protein